MGGDGQYDLFMSYSHADAGRIIKPLVEVLEAFGLEIWHDSTEIRVGDSIRKSIDDGLRTSNFGVAILSENYFKGTSEWELNGLVTRHNEEGNIILPLWYEIDRDDVYAQSPSLADLRAEILTEESIQSVAASIYQIVTESEDAITWGQTNNVPDSTPSFVDIDVRFQEYFDPNIGDEVTVLAWRNHNAPGVSSIEATKIREEERGLEYKSGSHGTIMTVRRIDDEPLNGTVSDVKRISSGRSEFTLLIDESRLKDLPDDNKHYKSLF